MTGLVEPFDQHRKTNPSLGFAITGRELVPSSTSCRAVPMISPLAPSQEKLTRWYFWKIAVTSISFVASSLRLTLVFPSLHLTNRYPLAGIARTRLAL